LRVSVSIWAQPGQGGRFSFPFKDNPFACVRIGIDYERWGDVAEVDSARNLWNLSSGLPTNDGTRTIPKPKPTHTVPFSY